MKRQIDFLLNAGYNSKDLSIFMLYNWDIPFDEMEKKRIKCWEWKVQINDCRFRPLNQTFDNYNPYLHKKGQGPEDYHIHEEAEWTDHLVRQFRKNVRRQNIAIRQDVLWYSRKSERKIYDKEFITKYKKKPYDEIEDIVEDAWDPGVKHEDD